MGIPDEDIPPHATAAAQETVAKHQEPQELKFWSGWFCPFNQRVWISIEEKRIPYEYKEVNPYKKEQHFLAINPKGLVPALEHKGRALYESTILCEYLEDAFPAHYPLLPNDPGARAEARIWIDGVTKRFVPAFQRVLQSQEADKQKAALEDLYEFLREFAARAKGPYFVGNQWGMVDVALAPFVARDWILQEHRGYKRSAVGEKWVKYAGEVECRPSVAKTMSSRENLMVIYNRYLKDEAQSEVAKATRAGKVLP